MDLAHAYLFLILVLTAAVNGAQFCIRKNSPVVKDEHRQCEILATAFTDKETDIFYRTMCKDHVKNIKGDYSYLKIRHSVLEDRQSYKDLCQNYSKSLLAWIPIDMVRNNITQGLDKKERNFYIGKATDGMTSKTELCYFSQADLLSNETSNFSCTLMIFEDNFYGLDSDIHVLVEILPIFYEIRDITYEPWTNVTHNYKTLLGKTVLQNPTSQEKLVYGTIDYGFLELIKVDTASLLSTHLEKLPFAFHHQENVINLVNGAGNVEIRKKFDFSRMLTAKTSLKVDLIGQWSDHRRLFRANLYENFGSGFSSFKEPIDLTKISIVKISNTEPVFENMESVRVYKRNDESARLTQGGLGENVTSVNVTSSDRNHWGHPYPNFFPYFVVGCIIVGLALLIPIANIACILKKENYSVI